MLESDWARQARRRIGRREKGGGGGRPTQVHQPLTDIQTAPPQTGFLSLAANNSLSVLARGVPPDPGRDKDLRAEVRGHPPRNGAANALPAPGDRLVT